jgi:Fe-Mn family superoxide dismutase
MKNRREFLKTTALAAGSLAMLSLRGNAAFFDGENKTPFILPPLGYAYDALEPYIDVQTMQIHHDKHHKAYVDNLNKAVIADKLESVSLNDLLKNISTRSVAIRNNGGGHYNHSLFWKLMKPNGGIQTTGKLTEAITTSFGSIENFKTKFNDAAKSRFGSGWAWLILTKEGKLEITSTPNQDNPLMDVSDVKGKPILALDVWEHAYYLKYQNMRIDYINAWWNVVNWNEAEINFLS